MANFIPAGTIRIGRVPFDNSYRHTITFGSASAQTSYFASVCPKALSDSDYTYVRMNSSIKVGYNAEELYTYNYVMYQNANYGNKWFYAFITGINYINQNATELVLELDVMQTWYFDYTLSECFVEREHVDDDTIYKHTNPEPAMPLEYQSANYTEEIYDQGYIVIQSTAYPRRPNADSLVVEGADAITGGIYDGQYSAAEYVIFDMDSNGIASAKRFMKDLNTAGAADAVSNIFTVPSELLPASALKAFSYDGSAHIIRGTKQLKESYSAEEHPFGQVQSPSFGGYTPRNNKLYSFPYSYCSVGDFTGTRADYKFELSSYGGSTKYIQFALKAPVNSEMQGIIRAKDYDGEPLSKETLAIDLSNKCPWTYSAYQNWSAQNQLSIAMSLLSGIGGAAVSLVPGVNAAAGILGLGSVGQLTSTVADIDRMSKTPNEARGNIVGNSKLGSDTYGYWTCNTQIREEYARIVDEFFDMFGYEVDRVKVPNRTGRPSWNYVKTRNACHHGNVPASDMAKINRIFDSGITFWHSAAVGNYSVANK